MIDKEPKGFEKLNIAQAISEGKIPEGTTPEIVFNILDPIRTSTTRPSRRRVAEIRRPFVMARKAEEQKKKGGV